MVEQEAVNFEVAGSSPAPGARQNVKSFLLACETGYGKMRQRTGEEMTKCRKR